jgi:hypothetical protein
MFSRSEKHDSLLPPRRKLRTEKVMPFMPRCRDSRAARLKLKNGMKLLKISDVSAAKPLKARLERFNFHLKNIFNNFCLG